MIFHKLAPSRNCLTPLVRRVYESYYLFNTSNGCQVLSARSVSRPPGRQHTGLDTVRAIGDGSADSEQEVCHFPMLKQLGISTDGKTHSLSLKSDIVIKYIKLGAINKNLAVQYCHYLVHLCSEANQNELEYYTARVDNLLQYILKKYSDLPRAVKVTLLADAASTSAANCTTICKSLFDEYNLWPDVKLSALTKLLSACYKFKLWDVAGLILDKRDSEDYSWRAHDVLITSISELILSKNLTQEENETLRRDILAHLKKLFEISRKRRIQFVTTQPDLLVQCLESLMPDVHRRPVLKMSGRCTHCNNHIPLYDNKSVSDINSSIKQLLDKRHLGNLTIHSSKSDIDKFYKFLADLHLRDKKPIDCVIDGLNLAYKNTYGHVLKKINYTEDVGKTLRKQNPQFQVQVLANAIIRSNFLEKFRKILVIGKAHMKKWPGLLEFFEKNNIHFYASDNQTKDDLFMLYASTLNPKTLLVTNDFLRDHLALLGDEQKTQLERYIDTRQVWIDNKTLRAIWPTPFEKLPHADETGDHFHVPMIDYNKIDLIAQHQPPPHLNSKITTWLCCSTTKQSKNMAQDEAEDAADIERVTEAN